MNCRPLAFRPSVIAFAVCIGVVACESEPKRQLRMNLPTGSSFELTTRASRDLSITNADGDEGSMKGSSGLHMLLRVDSVYENGDYLASITIEKVDRNAFRKNLERHLAGARFSARISPLGEVKELIGSDEMRESIRISLPSPPAPDSTTEPRTPEEFVMMSVADPQLKAPLEFALRIWPSVPVSPGDTWESAPVYDPEIDAFMTRAFTLKSWDAAEVAVSFVSDFKPAQSEGKYEFNGSGKGEIRIAPLEGVPRSSRSTRTLSGTIQVNESTLASVVENGSTQVDFVPR